VPLRRGRETPAWPVHQPSFDEFDRQTGQIFYRREYVPASELARVRQWVRRSRAASASGRAVMGYLRRYVRGSYIGTPSRAAGGLSGLVVEPEAAASRGAGESLEL
jgi:hypothetical protein